MELTMENQFLRVEVTSFGAELTSLYHKGTQREYIWGGDSNIWVPPVPHSFPKLRLGQKRYVSDGGQALQRRTARLCKGSDASYCLRR